MNKKIFLIITIINILLLASFSFAKQIGDVVGNVYSTDIKAFINDVPVNAYNIGGRTCIAIEEVTTDYTYNNNDRLLLVGSLAPEYLTESNADTKATKVGQVVGKVLYTDIQTYFYNVNIPSYNIDGKTCVAIEDIGQDNAFSKIGGKYVWNPTARTISLEYMYDFTLAKNESLLEILRESNFNLTITDNNAVLESDFVNSGAFESGFSDSTLAMSEFCFPIYLNDEIIGYSLRIGNMYYVYEDAQSARLEKNGFNQLTYIYFDKLKEIIKNIPTTKPSKEEIISDLIETRMATVNDRFDTENYSVLYMSQATPRGKNDLIVYVRADGSFEFFHNKISGLNVSTYSNVVFDKENETMSVTLNGSRINENAELVRIDGTYKVDLKTFEIID